MTLMRDFIELVATHTGLNFRERDHALLRNKIEERIARYRGSEWDYYRLLKDAGPESAQEWSALATLLTTGESYFFRDKAQFALLRNRILPELIKRSGGRQLRIWSAGCSTGEEPYSLALAVKELLPVGENRQIRIMGTDINAKAIEQAEKGSYTEWSFRQTAPDLRGRFFLKRKECWEIDPDIRAMVTFRRCNLVTDPFPDPLGELHGMDLIVCRNVFIYFHPEAVGQVVRKFALTLAESGYLMTGHGELHAQSPHRLKARMLDDQMILQKVPEGEDSPAPVVPPAPVPVTRPTAKAYAAAKRERRPGATAGAARRGSPAGSAEKAAPADAAPQKLATCLELARSRADQGDYRDAAAMCRSAIALAPLSPLPHFLLAQVSEASGDVASAKDCLKKAIYLDPDLIAAHLELGALYLSEGNGKLAARSIGSARALLQGSPQASLIPPYHATTALELLRHADYLLTSLKEKEQNGA